MAKKSVIGPSPRSKKAGRPIQEITGIPRVRRRQKTATAAVRKDTTVFQSSQGIPARAGLHRNRSSRSSSPGSVRAVIILALNCGSSSLKFQVFASDKPGVPPAGARRLALGVVERIGNEATLAFQAERELGNSGEREPVRDHEAAGDPGARLAGGGRRWIRARKRHPGG